MKMPVQKSLFTLIAVLIIIFTIANVTPASAAKKSKKHNTGSNTTAQQMIITSTGLYDGWLLESRETSGLGKLMERDGPYLHLGDTYDRKQYRSILSFKTSVLPDNATITNVFLKIKQYSIIGRVDPATIMGGFDIDIVNGHFGTSPDLQITDFQIATNDTYGPINPTPSPYKIYNFSLYPIKNFINKTNLENGVTQLRLGFDIDDNNDNITNVLQIYSGDAPQAADRPKLVINYSIP